VKYFYCTPLLFYIIFELEVEALLTWSGQFKWRLICYFNEWHHRLGRPVLSCLRNFYLLLWKDLKQSLKLNLKPIS